MSWRKDILDLAAEAWRVFECAPVPPRVDPSIPILFFGDLEAYCESELRVVTVALNPAANEFPNESPFCRFPLADGITPEEHERYLDALSDYFRANPYMSWFSAFEPMLCGMGASYYAGKPSTALHTDICSPVATNPGWSGLDREARKALMACGGPLWHRLLEALCPKVVVISVGKDYLSHIKFEKLSEWEKLHTFDKSDSGELWKQSIMVWVRWYKVCGKPTLFAFIRAAQRPLAWLSNAQKCEAGKLVLEEWERGRGCG